MELTLDRVQESRRPIQHVARCVAGSSVRTWSASCIGGAVWGSAPSGCSSSGRLPRSAAVRHRPSDVHDHRSCSCLVAAPCCSRDAIGQLQAFRRHARTTGEAIGRAASSFVRARRGRHDHRGVNCPAVRRGADPALPGPSATAARLVWDGRLHAMWFDARAADHGQRPGRSAAGTSGLWELQPSDAPPDASVEAHRRHPVRQRASRRPQLRLGRTGSGYQETARLLLLCPFDITFEMLPKRGVRVRSPERSNAVKRLPVTAIIAAAGTLPTTRFPSCRRALPVTSRLRLPRPADDGR